MQSWLRGRDYPPRVIGPVGVEAMMDGVKAMYAADVRYRVQHHGENYMPVDGSIIRTVVDEAVASADGVEVFSDGLMRIVAFAVDHYPVVPALGYRFEYKGRSVVVTGDTSRSAAVALHSSKVDVLVHDALNAKMMSAVASIAGDKGLRRANQLMQDILTYHATPQEAVETAIQAEVQLLLLTHLVPDPANRFSRDVFLSGLSQIVDEAAKDLDKDKGKPLLQVTMAEDGMEVVLPVGSTRVIVNP